MSDPFIVADEARGHRDSPLNPAHVNTVFGACLTDSDGIVVNGIAHSAMFSQREVDRYRAEIAGMLDQLPAQFNPLPEGGGGWSFLNLCQDGDGNQWTDLHLVMERLVMLGIATNQAEWQFPRKMWSALPGSVPYVLIRPDTAAEAPE
jgi:hypothetical protein